MFLDNRVRYSEDDTSLFLRGGLSCPMLGPGQQVDAIINNDTSTLSALGYTCDKIAQAVFNLFTQTQSGRLTSIAGFEIEEHEEIFLPPCPLCGEYEDIRIPRILEIIAIPQHNRDEIYAEVARSGEKFIVGETRKFAADRGALIFSKLHPHLIGQHSFFQGQTPYRLSPESLIPFLIGAKLL